MKMKFFGKLKTFVFILIFMLSCPLLAAQDSSVSITDQGTYYEVILDYTTGISHYNMGKLMAQKLLPFIPNIEQMADALLTESTGTNEFYNICINRMYDIKPQVQQEYIDEIEGLISVLCSSSENIWGDNKLSPDEFYVLQLNDEVIRASQCSSVSVFGERSATGNPIVAKILDYPDGSDHFQSKTQAIITIKNNKHSICKIGSLSVGGGTGFNDEGIFVSLHDSPVGAPYSSSGKRAYLMDIRYALENYSTLDEVVDYFMQRSKDYVTNRLFQMADKNRVIILENNFSGFGTNVRCGIRTDSSKLNQGITWEFPGAVATVNSFVLEGNYDNHTPVLSSTQRWESIKAQLGSYGKRIGMGELKQMVSFDNGDGPGQQIDGDLYNEGTIMITLFQPDVFSLQVAFKPRTGVLPEDPNFEKIPVYIGKTTSVEENKLLPNEYSLKQNYPNPFNPTTKINFTLPNEGTRHAVSLRIFDILGNEVATLVNEEKAAGEYEFSFDASKYDLSSGIYFYCLQAGKFIDTKKLVLIR